MLHADKCPKDMPVVITSYEIAMRDRRALQKVNFKYMVVDEGHRLKNSNCRLVRELKQIPAENKLLLTGMLRVASPTRLHVLMDHVRERSSVQSNVYIHTSFPELERVSEVSEARSARTAACGRVEPVYDNTS